MPRLSRHATPPVLGEAVLCRRRAARVFHTQLFGTDFRSMLGLCVAGLQACRNTPDRTCRGMSQTGRLRAGNRPCATDPGFSLSVPGMFCTSLRCRAKPSCIHIRAGPEFARLAAAGSRSCAGPGNGALVAGRGLVGGLVRGHLAFADGRMLATQHAGLVHAQTCVHARLSGARRPALNCCFGRSHMTFFTAKEGRPPKCPM